jgi:hypothetical protein
MIMAMALVLAPVDDDDNGFVTPVEDNDNNVVQWCALQRNERVPKQHKNPTNNSILVVP